MRVGIEKRYIDSYKNIAREVNNIVKGSKKALKKEAYRKALESRNISVENKKKKLAKALHELILHTFSIDIRKIKNSKKALESVKGYIALIREIIHKIKSLNNYLEEIFLAELGIASREPLILKALKAKKPERFLQSKRGLPKDYISKIEHTVYKLMQEIVIFDEKLLEGYVIKEATIIGKEKVEIKDLENLLRTESELLDLLEAKMPPQSKIKAKLFGKEIFNKWIPMVFALLAGLEAEYRKEALIFLKVKKNTRLRNKIEDKIKHIVDEKEKILKIKEQRALSMKSFGKISDEYRKVFHEYINAARKVFHEYINAANL
ncbi:hypothetical protein HYU50_03820 [Candidatus Woesearchaeota archaeon]|nr:hypothetical protein [Candidatus Woesearchaeota archaeon]